MPAVRVRLPPPVADIGVVTKIVLAELLPVEMLTLVPAFKWLTIELAKIVLVEPAEKMAA